MHEVQFILLKHDRLNFENSIEKVQDFLLKRLNYFNAKLICCIERKDLAEIIAEIANDSDYIAVIDMMNPIVDIELLKTAKTYLKNSKALAVTVEGAIPGTQFEYLLAPGVKTMENICIKQMKYFSQDKYNNQFNLYKYKRLKLFLFLLAMIDNMYLFTVDDFILKLSEKDIFLKLTAFGEDVKIKYYDTCPYCGCKELVALPMRMSQPFCGYIPVEKALYHECADCGLIVVSPYIDNDDSSKVYDKFDKQDFVVTLNNPYTKGTPRCDVVLSLNLPAKSYTLDLGGGMGNFSKFLKQMYPDFIVTHSDFAIKQNEHLKYFNINTKAINFINEKINEDSYDLITAWEVIEHISFERFDDAMKNIFNGLKKGGYFVFSTPDFDSPLCKMNDFFALCPPFHYTVFSKTWLSDYFKTHFKEWKIIKTVACSDFLDDASMWCDYSMKTAPSFSLRATAKVLKVLLEKDENKKLLLENNMGTEVIFVLQKI